MGELSWPFSMMVVWVLQEKIMFRICWIGGREVFLVWGFFLRERKAKVSERSTIQHS